MNITEELLELVSLKGTTTGRDIKEAVINCALSRQIDLKNLVGIATNGAPLIVGKIVGAVSLIFDHTKALGNSSNDFEMLICICFFAPQESMRTSVKYVACDENCSQAPFNVEVESAPPNLQTELIELQSSIELKSLCERNKFEYYHKHILDDKFPNLKRLFMRIISAFGTQEVAR
ncbi:dimer_Tnp_hAT domain-containing protein [Trichonephila clavipes]|nr:dimer_Tnp_hAT domain-containing protein [Trichonephila clavipes]